ncbi:hypothetical protein [Candidatus Protochlamydia phocaeensis]|uniref:hypothetical protein n=1 Tax=Candidatus Protochlamydia phocaeensis TaxID=1414722 RepID=UPI0008387BE1|nr:hypothetical protein [Candidatus Protochlamydia phocaeensis]
MCFFYSNLPDHQGNGPSTLDHNPYAPASSFPLNQPAHPGFMPATQNREPDKKIILMPDYLEKLILNLWECNEKIKKHKEQLPFLESDLREEEASYIEPPSFHFPYVTKLDARMFIRKYMPEKTRMYLQMSMKEEVLVNQLAEKDLHYNMRALIRKVIDIHKQVQQQFEQEYGNLTNQINTELNELFPMLNQEAHHKLRKEIMPSIPSENKAGTLHSFIQEDDRRSFQPSNPSEMKFRQDINSSYNQDINNFYNKVNRV